MIEFITEINRQAPANLGVHGRKVLFKIFSIEVTSNIEEKFNPFRNPYPDFRCFLLNFLADLDSPIFSSEEAFRFLVLTSPTSNSLVDHLDYHTHKCTVNSFRTFFNGIFVDVLKVTSAKKLATLVLINSHVGLVGLGAGIQKIQR